MHKHARVHKHEMHKHAKVHKHARVHKHEMHKHAKVHRHARVHKHAKVHKHARVHKHEMHKHARVNEHECTKTHGYANMQGCTNMNCASSLPFLPYLHPVVLCSHTPPLPASICAVPTRFVPTAGVPHEAREASTQTLSLTQEEMMAISQAGAGVVPVTVGHSGRATEQLAHSLAVGPKRRGLHALYPPGCASRGPLARVCWAQCCGRGTIQYECLAPSPTKIPVQGMDVKLQASLLPTRAPATKVGGP